VNPTNDWTLPVYSLIRGLKTERMLGTLLGPATFEELPRRFFCVSADITARRLHVHNSGLLRDAVRASVSLPGIFPPVRTAEGHLLVDGGVIDNLPVATMAARGEGPIIAVDVTGAQGIGSTRPTRETSWGPRVRRLLSGQEEQLPRLADTMLRSLTVSSVDTVAAARQHADVVITPNVEGIGLLDWSAIQRSRAAGRAAVDAVLAADPEAFDRCRG
jgi:NTE family protein